MATTGYDDPAVQRRRLRVELKKARLDALKTQRDVADAMDWSASKVIRIENGEVRISRNDLRALLAYYEITDDQRIERLLDIAKEATRGEELWTEFQDLYSPAFLTYLRFESSAWIIRNYEPVLVPGLLQTEEYAIALATEAFGAARDVADRSWYARQQRQKLHERSEPPQMWFVVDEAVIRRPVGGPGVLRRQLRRLREWNTEPHISLQVMPFSAGPHPGIGSPFLLLEFSEPDDDNLLYLEQTPDTTRDDAELTGIHLNRFIDHLERKAMSKAETNTFLDDTIAALEAEAADSEEEEDRKKAAAAKS